MVERYIMDNNNDNHLSAPHGLDESLFSASAVTRKRKISKMWDAICGNSSAENNFVQQFYGHIGRPPEDNRQPHKEQRKDSTSKMAGGWRMDEIDGVLAADFDDSLTGLGVEAGTASYNMSETLLASLPTIPVFKQEPLQETRLQQSTPVRCRQNQSSPSPGGVNSISLQQQHHGGASSLPHSPTYAAISTSSLIGHAHSSTPPPPPPPLLTPSNHFQYVLAASTSIATKIHEETLTYLNQGQSYEIKLKKLGDVTEYRGKLLKSVVRVCFHERRLQYMEKEQISNWRHMRPGERILEIDIPLSYGINDVFQDPHGLNNGEFVWDPTKETGVFVRVNCISTEFTPKKHGGEKGVPFRIQIETYTHGDGIAPQRLHCASCQVKVFKPKGADRKHKTDREKMEKRPMGEQDKYQPSYDCTVLTECPFDSVYSSSTSSLAKPLGKTELPAYQYSPGPEQRGPGTPVSIPADSPVSESTDLQDNPMYHQILTIDSTVSQATQWLHANGFGSYIHRFRNFSGADLLRLSKEDLTQLFNLEDGMRLHNAFHSKLVPAKLTLYLHVDSDQVCHGVYLYKVTCEELTAKISGLINIQRSDVQSVLVQGPSGTHLLVTDDVVRNLRNESVYVLDLLQGGQVFNKYDQNGGQSCRLLLKPSNSHF